MKTITQSMKTRMAQPKESETEDDLFGKMIASELKKFPENLKFRLRHHIDQVIYNYKLNQYNTMVPPISAIQLIPLPLLHHQTRILVNLCAAH